jgi:hypothetical protein
MDIVFVLVDIIAKHLLTLFIDGVDVVDNNHFFLTVDRALGLTEDFHFVPVIIDALFFQIVDKENIDFGDVGSGRHSIIFANETVKKGGFPGPLLTNKENVEVVNLEESANEIHGLGVHTEVF